MNCIDNFEKSLALEEDVCDEKIQNSTRDLQLMMDNQQQLLQTIMTRLGKSQRRQQQNVLSTSKIVLCKKPQSPTYTVYYTEPIRVISVKLHLRDGRTDE